MRRLRLRAPKIDRLSWKLGISAALLVCGATAAGSALFYQRYYQQLLASARASMARETWLIREALEYQMLQKDRRLIRRMVDGFTRQAHVRRVMILDREGEVRFSSDHKIHRRHFGPESETCQVCHRQPVAQRPASTVLDLEGGSVLRCVQPIANRPSCHGCHDPRHRINGVIIVDALLEPSRAALERSVRHLAVGTGSVALVLLVGFGLLFRRLVMRRLLRFESAARAIADGELDRRVAVAGNDALARVEQQFNVMADSVTGLLSQLREQRASLEKVMNSVDDGMVVLDQQRRIVAVNDAFVRRFARGDADLIGRSCCEGRGLLGAGVLSCGRDDECPTLGCFETGAVRMALRTRMLADGGERQEEVRSSPVLSETGSIAYVVEVWRDITDRRSAEARLADYQRMVSLGMLASGFSHELNTPLASIGTCLDGIRRTTSAAAQQAEQQPGQPQPGRPQQQQIADYVRIAQTQVQRCGAITEQFLRLARGKTLARDIVDLPSCAQVVARLCGQPAGEAQVTVEVDAATDLPPVLANSSAVQQVLLNLVQNAIQASAAGQTVGIGFEDAGDAGVRVVVRDEGRGMAPEDLARIFEPFFTRRKSGSGLGLFVSMNLARGWGGDIVARSELGRGTTFTVIFPRPEDSKGDGGNER